MKYKLIKQLNDKRYKVEIRDNLMWVQRDTELGNVVVAFWRSDNTIKTDSYVDLEIVEIAIKLFKELYNGSDD